LRPRLHPDMGATVLCARVALQLTLRTYRASGRVSLGAAYHARLAASQLPPDYPGFLRFALHSLAVYLDLNWRGEQWLAGVLEAAHFGSSFRRCFFFGYKENRSPYPRVTNRGVQASGSGQQRRIKKGSINA
jgi:hypothetical protein